MSYAKAGELVSLALDIAARHGGLSMAEIDKRWRLDEAGSARRRTQRILGEIRMLFPDAYEEEMDPEGKTVRLSRNRVADLSAIGAKDIAALERSVLASRDHGDAGDAERLAKILSVVRTLLPEKGRARAETDIEALLQCHHLAARPGPQPLYDRGVIEPLSDALLSMRQVAFDYRSRDGVKQRTVDPLGLLTGHRTYLVARVAGISFGDPSHWRLDRMSNVEVLSAPSEMPAGFSLAAHAKRAFGMFQSKSEYGDVVWRFRRDAAENAKSFRFHPDQTVEEHDDGSITVRFRAAGHLEMAWFLYQWGDAVEVLEPAALRDMIENHCRNDFAALP